MINSRNLAPQIYSKESRDFQLFCTLLDLVVNSTKLDIDLMDNLMSVDYCPDKYLPNLASILGYNYRNDLLSSENRIIMQYFKSMIKNRGTQYSVELAVSAFLKIKDLDIPYNVTIMNDTLNSQVIIYVSLEILNLDTTLLAELIELIRPVGVKVSIFLSKIRTYGNIISVPNRLVTYTLASYPIDPLATEGNRELTVKEHATTEDAYVSGTEEDLQNNKVGFSRVSDDTD